MKKGDYMIIGVVLILAAVFFVYSSLSKTHDYDTRVVKISINNELYETFEISSDTSKSIDIVTPFGHNHIEIKNGEVWISESDCPDKICVLDGKIDEPGEILVCLPHKLIIEIVGVKNTEVDEIAY